jgi:hypothetical protein
MCNNCKDIPALPVSDRYKRLGKHYGYPDCCISWFEDRAYRKVSFHLTQYQEDCDMGHGFIPCPACAEKLHKEDKSLNSLITDREHPYPFPHSDYQLSEQLLNLKD